MPEPTYPTVIDTLGKLIDHGMGAFTACRTRATRSRQEQDPFRPVRPHQQIAKRDNRSRFAGARGHHQQRLALTVLLERL